MKFKYSQVVNKILKISPTLMVFFISLAALSVAALSMYVVLTVVKG